MKRVIRKRPFYGSTVQEVQPHEIPHREISRRAAAEGIVLLKNEKQALPLKEGAKVALYGPGATHMIKGGTGSGDVNERNVVNIYQGLVNAGYHVTSEEWNREYDRIFRDARIAWRDDILKKAEKKGRKEFFSVYSTTPFFVPDGPDVTKTDADTAIYVLSRVAGEGADRFHEKGDYDLTAQEEKNIEDICRFYEKVILVVNTGGLVDLSFTDKYDNIYSILQLVQPGMEGGSACADVISGKVTPSGKMTDTWAEKYEDYPNAMTFSHMNGNVEKEKYEEGIFVGYRYFDSFGISVRYSFGYGLSYTDFQMETTGVSAVGAGIEVEVKVTNTGLTYSGKEVVQVYVSLPLGELKKEYRRLCGFAKTSNLAPGESETVKVGFPAYRAASYDPASAEWILEKGTYGIWIGNCLSGSKLEALLVLDAEKVLVKVKNICPLKEDLNEISPPNDRIEKLYENVKAAGQEQNMKEIVWDLSEVETESIDYDAPFEPDGDEAAEIVKGLSVEQLIQLAAGDPGKGQGSNLGASGVSVPGSAGETSMAAYEQGVANIVLADGPAGLRLVQSYTVKDGITQMPSSIASLEHGIFVGDVVPEGTPYYQFCTAIPVGTLLAQSWDENLIEEVGAMIAEEMELFGVTLWLAPGMNIHRNPLCGRNFEYYSEDPLVSGKIAAAMTRGVQRVEGCGTTIKHFACNNQEDNRKGSDSILSERALREIYLKGFEIAVKESRPMSIMTSYNLINGIHAANCYDICTQAARQEWGFDGVIMTDWTTTEDGPDCTASGCIRAGNDIVMPGNQSDHDNMREELEKGTLSEEDLRKCITRLVRVVLRSNLYQE